MSCPVPFIDEQSFPDHGGDIRGRWCKDFSTDSGDNLSCCFSCPITEWRYTHDLNSKLRIASWFGVLVLVLAGILSVSYVVLPAKETQRHYLTTSPLIGFVFMSAAFITPLVKTPNVCYNEITPHDWKSDPECAVSGCFIIFGAWVIVNSCFFRSLSLYLHLRWEMELGKRFMQIAVSCIFIGSAVLLVIALFITGFSYQIGKFCFISVYDSKKTFWGPLVAVGIVTLILQVMIMVYSIRVVINPLQIEGVLPSPIYRQQSGSPNSIRSVGAARQAGSRVWRILGMQWRAVVIVFAIALHIAFLAQFCLHLHLAGSYSLTELRPWLDCLVQSKGRDMGKECRRHATSFGPDKNIAITAFCLLASSGIWGFVCVWRWTMVLAWRDWFKTRPSIIKANTPRSLAIRRNTRNCHSYRPSADREWPAPTNYSSNVLRSPDTDDWSYFTLQTRRDSPADNWPLDSKGTDYTL